MINFSGKSIEELTIIKTRIKKLSDEIRDLDKQKKDKKLEINDIRHKCSDKILVKVSVRNDNGFEKQYYCIACEKKILNDLKIEEEKEQLIIDFSDFPVDEELIGVVDIINISFELFDIVKKHMSEILDENAVGIINQMIKENNDLVKDRIGVKALENISGGIKKLIK